MIDDIWILFEIPCPHRNVPTVGHDHSKKYTDDIMDPVSFICVAGSFIWSTKCFKIQIPCESAVMLCAYE